VSARFGVGARVGPYEIEGWLGAGGMGEVYRARDPRLGRGVALKLITGTPAADSHRVRRFEQEARAAGQLNHPNVVAVYDTGVHEGSPYIVSELLEGQSLRSRLSEGPLPWRKVLDFGRQAAEGLAAAHDRGIVHRDIKPDNIFITGDGRLKILDFGIAKLAATEDSGDDRTGLPTDTVDGAVVGTAGYMSPEQVRGERVDARSDLFSLGAVLYEMITGSPAFRRETPAETMTAILRNDPVEPAVPDAPTLPRIVMRCLEKSCETRFQSARDLAFALNVLTTSQPVAPVTDTRAFPWRLAAGVAILALSAGALAMLWLTSAPPSIESQLAAATFSSFTDFEGSESDAAISLDGKFAAFLADRSGPRHIWLKQVGTGPFKDITPDMGDLLNIGPTRSVGFSPDGEIWINGTRDRPLVLMPLMGGTPRPFLSKDAVNVTWSPDASRLVYFTYTGDPLIVADRKGDNQVVILPPKSGDHNHFPAYSIDGRWIYYVHGDQSVAEYGIWRIPAAGGSPERLADLRTDVRYLTPMDDRTVLYIAPAPDHSGPWLWALDATRKTTRRVSVGLERYLSIAASGDRQRLIATVAKSAASLWTVPIGEPSAGLAGEDAVQAVQLAMDRALAPRYGGGTLFYLSSTGAGDGLWRQQNGQPVEVIRGSDDPLSDPPAVSPTGDRVAATFAGHGAPHLTLVSADGLERHAIAASIDVRGIASWSPDGNWIAVGGRDDRGPGLFKIPVAGGEPVRLVSGPAIDPVWSPDGKVIAYGGEQKATAPLQAIREDGAPIALPPIPVPTGGRGRWRFLRSGTRLVYMQGPLGEQNFWLLDFATMKSRPLTRLSNPAATTTFDISPDGTHIVFDRVRERSDIVLIELPKRP